MPLLSQLHPLPTLLCIKAHTKRHYYKDGRREESDVFVTRLLLIPNTVLGSVIIPKLF